MHSGDSLFNLLLRWLKWNLSFSVRRTKAAMAHKRRLNEYCGSVPYGFDNDNGKLVENAYEQKILKQMKDLRNSGRSLSEIVSVLKSTGARNKAGNVSWYSSQSQD